MIIGAAAAITAESGQPGSTPARVGRHRLIRLQSLGVGRRHQLCLWGGRTVGGDTIHNTTSYDYDAPVSEYGGLTEKYFVTRRHHLFLSTLGTTIAPLLAEAKSGSPQVLTARAVAGRAAGGGDTAQCSPRRFHRHLPPQRYRRTANIPAIPDDRRPPTADRWTGPLPTHHALHTTPYHRSRSRHPQTHLHQPAPADSGLILRYHTGRILGFWNTATKNPHYLRLRGRNGPACPLRRRLANS
ncbi:MAG: hypothetical protein U0401_29245 [Anaerolineae bacterium]